MSTTPRSPTSDAGPSASSPDALARMQRQGRRDTAAEIELRRRLHALGLRFRVDTAPLSGVRRRSDVVFRPSKVAVFVDGCFWHSCPEHATTPKSNAAWWRDKLARNVRRDRETDARLTEAGWLPVRVWEHEDPAGAAARIHALVVGRREQ